MGRKMVSAIITTYNRPEYLLAAIDSVEKQTPGDFALEVVVVDDGSEREIRGPVLERFPEVRFFRRDRGGVSAARHWGSVWAEGDYIAWLDDDDLWLPDKIRTQFEFLERHPEIDWTFCDMVKFTEEGDKEKSIYETFDANIRQARPSRIEDQPPAWLYPRDSLVRPIFEGLPFYCQTIMMRKAAYPAMGGWNESIRRLGEDFDFVVRAAHSLTAAFQDQVLVKIRRHTGNKTRSLLRQHIEQQATVDWVTEEYPEDLRNIVRPLMGRFFAGTAWMAWQEGDYDTAKRLYAKSISRGYTPPGVLAKWALSSLKARPPKPQQPVAPDPVAAVEKNTTPLPDPRISTQSHR